MKAKMIMAIIPLAAGLAACDDFSREPEGCLNGTLSWYWNEGAPTKGSAEMPDTNDFILTVRDPAGQVVYEGTYGDSPSSIDVKPGSYTVRAVSLEFTAPAFGRPQYGDEQVVVVEGGKSVAVKLECTLLNAGMVLKISPEFITAFPDGVLYLKQAPSRLMYSYTEKRAAYFFPGEVALTLYNEGREETLLTRTLSARDMLSIKVSASSSVSSSISVAVDTTRNWRSEDYTIGEGSGDTGAVNVPDAALHVGEEDVWIYGYIVGGDLTSAGKSVKTSGITSKTHLALAARSSVTDKASCVAVELPSGKVRDAINLADHPDLIGTRIYLKGNVVEKYYGTTGLKGTSEFAQK
ncbi:MAG: DUF4493 domain-containing protein [Bacteroidales bacterium]|nr:DUF4493 domain-containing protein [Bacteroidales bacterium]